MNSRKCNGLQMNSEAFGEHKLYNNCYTYAINQPKNPYTGEPYKSYGHCQPATLGGISKDERKLFHGKNWEIMPRLAKVDLLDIGYEMVESTFEEFVPDDDCWKVAFAYCNDNIFGGDYHWYRQNDDGTWSHKLGQAEIKTTDDADNIIYNPETCVRKEYKHFGGFFIIRRKKPLAISA